MKRAALLAMLALAGCDAMIHQPKRNAYERSSPQGAPGPSQLPPAIVDFGSAAAMPPKLTLALLERGQAEFRQFCIPCHSELGDGNGIVAQRGFQHPPNYRDAKVLNASTQHYYDVLTNGAGAMYSFAQRIAPEDRWAIAAYIRALQLSGGGKPSDLSPQERAGLGERASLDPAAP